MLIFDTMLRLPNIRAPDAYTVGKPVQILEPLRRSIFRRWSRRLVVLVERGGVIGYGLHHRVGVPPVFRLLVTHQLHYVVIVVVIVVQREFSDLRHQMNHIHALQIDCDCLLGHLDCRQH